MKHTKKFLTALLSMTMLASSMFTAGAVTDLSSDGVKLDSTAFPDEAMLRYAQYFDNDKNSILSQEEINAVTTFNFPRNVKTLKGMEYFTEVTTVLAGGVDDDEGDYINSYNAMFSTLDLSVLPKLEKVELYINNDPQLDVKLSGLKNLKRVRLCSRYDIENYNYEGYRKPDTTAEAYGNVDLTDTPALERISITNAENVILEKSSPVTELSLDYVKNVDASVIESYNLADFASTGDNEQIAKIDFTKFENLGTICIQNTYLSGIDLSTLNKLYGVILSGTNIKDIKLPDEAENLHTLNIKGANFTDFSWIPSNIKKQLSTLEFSRINIKSFTAKDFPELHFVSISDCEMLKTIDLSAIKSQSLWIYDFSGNTKLEKVVLPNIPVDIYSKAFANCINLKKLVIKSSDKVSCDSDAFKNVPSTMKIYVPKNAKGYYKAPWSKFTTVYGTSAESKKICAKMEKEVKSFTPKYKATDELYNDWFQDIIPKWSTSPEMTGYKLYYSTSKNGKYKAISKYTSKHGIQKKIGNTKLKVGKKYYVKIKGYKKVGSKYVYSKASKIICRKCKSR